MILVEKVHCPECGYSHKTKNDFQKVIAHSSHEKLGRCGACGEEVSILEDVDILKNIVVVSRHPAFIEYLQELGVDTSKVVSHASIEDVRGKNVIGNLPPHLMAEAETTTVIPLEMTSEDRGQELDLERIRQIAGTPRTYETKEI